MASIKYSDEQRAEFLDLAKEVGITRAKRDLGFPNSWWTAKRWVDAAGIEIPLDEIKSQAAAHRDWYKTEEALVVVQEGLLRAHESLMNGDLNPDEQKKLSEAVQKYINTWLLLQNRATNISESRKTDGVDIEIMELLNAEKARNSDIESTVTSVTTDNDKEDASEQ